MSHLITFLSKGLYRGQHSRGSCSSGSAAMLTRKNFHRGNSNQMRDFDLGLSAPVTFSPNDHQGSHKVSGTQLDETGHYQAIDLE